MSRTIHRLLTASLLSGLFSLIAPPAQAASTCTAGASNPPPLFSDFNRIHGYRYLGANLVKDPDCGTTGAFFRVWLPNAKSVEVILTSEGYQAGLHPLSEDWNTGIWGVYVPGVKAGETYQYRIVDARGVTQFRNDPYSRFTQYPAGQSNWASTVVDPDAYVWKSPAFTADRTSLKFYEVHPGTIVPGKPWANWREIGRYLAPLLNEYHYTAVSFMPIQQHNVVESWGYQAGSLFSVDPRHGSPGDFKAMVDFLHMNGIAVVIDLIHSHASKDWNTGLSMLDGTQLYFHEGIMGTHPSWDTMLYNYGRNEVKDFLLSNGLFWLDEYRVDGFRFDAVASMLFLDYDREPGKWVPAADGSHNNYPAVEYMKAFNREMHNFKPSALTIAEESSGYNGVTSPNGLGFNYVWRMGGMHDIRNFLGQPGGSRNLFTLTGPVDWRETYVNYADSHDEVAHGKHFAIDYASEWNEVEQFAVSRNIEAVLSLIYPGLPMDFQGNEFGIRGWWNETTPPELAQVQPGNLHDRYRAYQRDLGELFQKLGVLRNQAFWSSHNLMVDNGNQVLVQSRLDAAGKAQAIIVQSYAQRFLDTYEIPLPGAGPWKVIFNSDAPEYGGRGSPVALGEVSNVGYYGAPNRLTLRGVPAQSTLVLVPATAADADLVSP